MWLAERSSPRPESESKRRCLGVYLGRHAVNHWQWPRICDVRLKLAARDPYRVERDLAGTDRLSFGQTWSVKHFTGRPLRRSKLLCRDDIAHGFSPPNRALTLQVSKREMSTVCFAASLRSPVLAMNWKCPASYSTVDREIRKLIHRWGSPKHLMQMTASLSC